MNHSPKDVVITLEDAIKGRGSRVFKVCKLPKNGALFRRIGRDYRNEKQELYNQFKMPPPDQFTRVRSQSLTFRRSINKDKMLSFTPDYNANAQLNNSIEQTLKERLQRSSKIFTQTKDSYKQKIVQSMLSQSTKIQKTQKKQLLSSVQISDLKETKQKSDFYLTHTDFKSKSTSSFDKQTSRKQALDSSRQSHEAKPIHGFQYEIPAKKIQLANVLIGRMRDRDNFKEGK